MRTIFKRPCIFKSILPSRWSGLFGKPTWTLIVLVLVDTTMSAHYYGS